MPDEIDPQTTFVPMKHGEHGGVAMTTLAAFAEVWEPNGWERVTSDNASQEELTALARDHSVNVPSGADAATISAALNPDQAQEQPKPRAAAKKEEG
jgi:hypothetical protein